MNAREEEAIRIGKLKDDFELISRKIRLLCALDDVYILKSNNIVQVKLKIVCQEPEYVANSSEEFDDYSVDEVCYIRGRYFRNEMLSLYDTDIEEFMEPEKLRDFLKEKLKNKLIIVKPDYYYGSDGVFYKNGRNPKIIEKSSKSSKYFAVPIIRNEELLDKIIKNEQPVPLTNISRLIDGNIEYLYCNNKLYVLSMNYIQNSSVSSDEEYNLWKRRENTEMQTIDFNCEEAIENNDIIIDTDCDYVFVSKDALFETERKEVEVKKENEMELDEKVEVRNQNNDILEQLLKYIKQSNLCYTMDDIYNFFTCARTSQLVILAGMSGTGKTKLPIKFANFFNMNEQNNTLLFVPISPSFTEPSDVLGFLNPSTGIYSPAETRLVEFLKKAEENPDTMHMIIFDEMNLSQIEYWFAPFMSILEKNKDEKYLYLYSENQRCINNEKYPSKIKIGKNVLMIGTINLDETTKNISDRLLDRAYIINLKKKSFKDYYASNTNIDIKGEVKIADTDFCKFVPDSTDVEDNNYISRFNDRQLEFFDKIHEILNATDPQKGISFRSVKNISLYLENIPVEFDEKKAFDYAFKQTVMKKINGSVESIGEFLGYYTNSEEKNLLDVLEEYSDISDFTESKNEIKNKIAELKKYGYAK